MVIFQLGQYYKAEHFGINKGSALPFLASAKHSSGNSSKSHLKTWGNITSGFGEICIRQLNLDIFLHTKIYCCFSDVALPHTSPNRRRIIETNSLVSPRIEKKREGLLCFHCCVDPPPGPLSQRQFAGGKMPTCFC